jgi:hypothetical protein
MSLARRGLQWLPSIELLLWGCTSVTGSRGIGLKRGCSAPDFDPISYRFPTEATQQLTQVPHVRHWAL